MDSKHTQGLGLGSTAQTGFTGQKPLLNQQQPLMGQQQYSSQQFAGQQQPLLPGQSHLPVGLGPHQQLIGNQQLPTTHHLPSAQFQTQPIITIENPAPVINVRAPQAVVNVSNPAPIVHTEGLQKEVSGSRTIYSAYSCYFGIISIQFAKTPASYKKSNLRNFVKNLPCFGYFFQLVTMTRLTK